MYRLRNKEKEEEEEGDKLYRLLDFIIIMPDSDATLKGEYKTNDTKSQNTKQSSSAKVTIISLSGISKKKLWLGKDQIDRERNYVRCFFSTDYLVFQ